jgi:hypothetical protein
MTLLRTAVETAASARWVLGPDTSTERIRRAASLRAEDLRHEAQLEKAMGANDSSYSGGARSAAFGWLSIGRGWHPQIWA